MRTLRLAGFSLFVFFFVIPAGILVLLGLLALGFITAICTVYGLLNVGMWLGGMPDVGGTAIASIGMAAGSFVLIVLIWDRIASAFGWLPQHKRAVDAPFVVELRR